MHGRSSMPHPLAYLAILTPLAACATTNDVAVELAPDLVSSIDGRLAVHVLALSDRDPVGGDKIEVSLDYKDRNGTAHVIEPLTGNIDDNGAFEGTFEGLKWDGSGTVTAGAVASVAVACVTNTYGVSATVSGLQGTGLVLQNNGAQDKAVAANGTVTFPSQLSGTPYAITVLTQPSAPVQACFVVGGTGTVAGAPVAAQVSCHPPARTATPSAPIWSGTKARPRISMPGSRTISTRMRCSSPGCPRSARWRCTRASTAAAATGPATRTCSATRWSSIRRPP